MKITDIIPLTVRDLMYLHQIEDKISDDDFVRQLCKMSGFNLAANKAPDAELLTNIIGMNCMPDDDVMQNVKNMTSAEIKRLVLETRSMEMILGGRFFLIYTMKFTFKDVEEMKLYDFIYMVEGLVDMLCEDDDEDSQINS